MHKEILTPEQKDLLPILKMFSDKFGMVGGTAIALHIGHRRSIDYDLFTDRKFHNATIQKKISVISPIDTVIWDEAEQYTVILRGVRFTFLQYPYSIDYSQKLNEIIKLPDLLTLAAMKAHTLGRRAKWKDYVDLYFIIKHYHGIHEIIAKAKDIFKQEFNEKLFRVQLSYYNNMDYSEKIYYLPGFETKDSVIKNALTQYSLES